MTRPAVDPQRAAVVKDLRRQAGRWLKAAREQAGLTQADVAERIGVKYYTFVSQVEGGFGRVPSEMYEAWAGALGVCTQEFARTLLRFYDPDVYRLLFPGEAADAPRLPARPRAGVGRS